MDSVFFCAFDCSVPMVKSKVFPDREKCTIKCNVRIFGVQRKFRVGMQVTFKLPR